MAAGPPTGSPDRTPARAACWAPSSVTTATDSTTAAHVFQAICDEFPVLWTFEYLLCQWESRRSAMFNAIIESTSSVSPRPGTTLTDSDCVAFSRLRLAGYNIVDRPRPRTSAASLKRTNHGGVAVIAKPGINVSAVCTVSVVPATFEYVCARVTTGQFKAIVTVIFRPGPDAVEQRFFDVVWFDRVCTALVYDIPPMSISVCPPLPDEVCRHDACVWGPQGSVLGPILFLLYTADLIALVERHGFCPHLYACLLYTSPSPRDRTRSRMPSSA